uniref:Uncharacterized protein n=1 Tax=Lepeophtheirus salmonis TaxID=72036 RepID=A0A0K2VIB4_LEPSM
MCYKSLLLLLLINAIKCNSPSSFAYSQTSLAHDRNNFLPRYSESIQYNGPIVYSNEKPPIIHFPPPPNLSNKDAHNKLSLPNQPVKYIPLPHHDLPVLIYQSEKQPPIHVVHPPMTKGKINQPAQKQTYSQSKISFSSDQIYEFPMRSSSKGKNNFKKNQRHQQHIEIDGEKRRFSLNPSNNFGLIVNPIRRSTSQINEEKSRSVSALGKHFNKLNPKSHVSEYKTKVHYGPKRRENVEVKDTFRPMKHVILESNLLSNNKQTVHGNYGSENIEKPNKHHIYLTINSSHSNYNLPFNEYNQYEQQDIKGVFENPQLKSYVKSKESSSLPNHQKVSQPNLRPMNHGKGSTSIKPDKKIESKRNPIFIKAAQAPISVYLSPKNPLYAPPSPGEFNHSNLSSHKSYLIQSNDYINRNMSRTNSLSKYNNSSKLKQDGRIATPLDDEKQEPTTYKESLSNIKEIKNFTSPFISHVRAQSSIQNQNPTLYKPSKIFLKLFETVNSSSNKPQPKMSYISDVSFNSKDIFNSKKNKNKILVIKPQSHFQKPSYVPPKPTYKPKPTHKPKPKPIYNPPPSSVPHIIYAGHPPIHIYQHPKVNTENSQSPKYQLTTPPDYISKNTKDLNIKSAKSSAYKKTYKLEDQFDRLLSEPIFKQSKLTYSTSHKHLDHEQQVKKEKSTIKNNQYPLQEVKHNKNTKRKSSYYIEPKNHISTHGHTTISDDYHINTPKNIVSTNDGLIRPTNKLFEHYPKLKAISSKTPSASYIHSNPVYIPAPRPFYKPPIIIYQGIVPPIHVYENPNGSPSLQTKLQSTLFNNKNLNIFNEGSIKKGNLRISKINSNDASTVLKTSVSIGSLEKNIVKKGKVENI